MNVERTMEFILEQQAATASWQAKTDRRLDAIGKLLKTGMRMLVQTDEKLKEVAVSHRQLAATVHQLGETVQQLGETVQQLAIAQKGTDRTLSRVIESMRRGSNGNKGQR